MSICTSFSLTTSASGAAFAMESMNACDEGAFSKSALIWKEGVRRVM